MFCVHARPLRLASYNDDITATLNNKGSSNVNYYRMSTSRSIKINFQGTSREVDAPTPATLSALQAAVASTFKVELAPRSEAVGGAETDLSFTYKDSDGDDIVFDRDSELSLALRLCPSPLEICAASKQKDKDVRGKEICPTLYFLPLLCVLPTWYCRCFWHAALHNYQHSQFECVFYDSRESSSKLRVVIRVSLPRPRPSPHPACPHTKLSER